MGTPDNKLSELVDLVKSWIPRRSGALTVSRDFWMPDQSCRVCYECDSQFTVFNRRHHCRICGRVFCARCTSNSIPAPSDERQTSQEDSERIRVCTYCFKQWEQAVETVDNGVKLHTPILSPSPSATSLASTQSSCTGISGTSTIGSTPYSTGPYQRIQHTSVHSPTHAKQMDLTELDQDDVTLQRSMQHYTDFVDPSSDPYNLCISRYILSFSYIYFCLVLSLIIYLTCQKKFIRTLCDPRILNCITYPVSFFSPLSDICGMCSFASKSIYLVSIDVKVIYYYYYYHIYLFIYFFGAWCVWNLLVLAISL